MELRATQIVVLVLFYISITFVVATTSPQAANKKSSETTTTTTTTTAETETNVIKVKRKKAINTNKLDGQGGHIFSCLEYIFTALLLITTYCDQLCQLLT